MFPFTFSLPVSGMPNPFTRSSESGTLNSRPENAVQRNKHRRSPSLPRPRKRGWVPSEPEPSQAATTAGYVYSDMQHDESELPPLKRRRTLAGSIVSTALSAALIGTAVGLTVYRLWRDRGKEQEQMIAPPPYQQGDWIQPQDIQVTPPTPKNRRTRHTPASAKRSTIRQRTPRPRTRPLTPPSPAFMPPPRPEFNFGLPDQSLADADEVEEEDEMDWIGDRLSLLIQEGQKALGKEVVVMSDSKEDEVDDGSGGWEEVDQPTAGPSRRGSIRRHRPKNIPIPTSHSTPSFASLSSSPRKRQFEISPTHTPSHSRSSGLPIPSTPRHSRGTSDSDVFGSLSSSFREDESSWQSPELRESMEKARARYLQSRR